MKSKRPKMKIIFANDDWSYSFDELKEKEDGLRQRLLEAYQQINALRKVEESGSVDDGAGMEHTRKAIDKYKKALGEVEELIRQRKSGTA